MFEYVPYCATPLPLGYPAPVGIVAAFCSVNDADGVPANPDRSQNADTAAAIFFTHVAPDASDTKPFWHATHTLAPTADIEFASHARHTVAPVVGPYVPAAHGCTMLFTHLLPTAHGAHVDADTAPVAELTVPAGHDVGAVIPVASQYVPAGQVVNALFPVPLQNAPTGHVWKSVFPRMLQYAPAGHGTGAVICQFLQYVPSGHAVCVCSPVWPQ